MRRPLATTALKSLLDTVEAITKLLPRSDDFRCMLLVQPCFKVINCAKSLFVSLFGGEFSQSCKPGEAIAIPRFLLQHPPGRSHLWI